MRPSHWPRWVWCWFFHDHDGHEREMVHDHAEHCTGEDLYAEASPYGHIWWCRGCALPVRLTIRDRPCYEAVPPGEVEWLVKALQRMAGA